mgnify:CR=1 FL=1
MLAAIATFFVAALHVLFMVFETFLWTTPKVRKRFGQTAEQAETTKVLAANQGVYNGALAGALIWVLFGLIEAEELGVTSQNAEQLRASSQNPSIRRLLGTEPGLGKALGLDEAWAYRAIKAVGNYGESFDRHLGKGSQVGLDRGLNDLWTRGGLMYATPMR